ncbi:MAG: hypothetical protein AAF600_15545 [Bacteroidota bacterium]
MRTSLTETKQIEDWLLKQGAIQNRLLLEAKMLSNPKVKENVQWQSYTYDLIRLYGREKLREEIKAIQHTLFQTPKYRSFQDRIRSIFKH